MADISQWATTAGGNDTGSTPDFPIEGMAPSAVNDTMRTNMAAIKRWYDDLKGYGLTTAGTGNAYTLTTTTTHAALTDQSLLVFEADRANTGSATLNVDGLGAKTIKKNGDENLVSGDIQANQIVIVAYENTADVYHLLTPPAAALDGIGSTTGADIANVSGVITTQGDLMIGDASGDETRLAVGSNLQVPQSDGTTISWVSLTYSDITFSNDIVAGDIASGAIGESELGSNSVDRSSLKSTTGDVTGIGDKTLPGGEYGFYPRVKSDSGNFSAQIAGSVTATGSFATIITLTNGNPSARQRYIQSSPPYDLGDGDCGLFVEADIRTNGTIAGLYVAPDPVWANNGPTSISPDWTDKETGKKYKRVRRPALTLADVEAGRADMADYLAAQREAVIEDVEITMAYKNADMEIIPHSWASPPQGTIVLLDPVNTHDLLMLHEAGEDVADLIHKGYIEVGDEVQRKGPPGVVPVSWKWKNT